MATNNKPTNNQQQLIIQAIDMAIYLERGKILLQQNRVDLAKQEFQKELTNNPNDAYAMGLLALCYSKEKENDKAIQFIEQAIGIDPTNIYLFYLQANIYLHANKIPQAKKAADEGLTLNPNTPALFQVKGSIALIEDNWEEALQHAEKGLELDPEDVDLVNLRARSLIQLNRRLEANATLDYALNKSPENPLAHTNKGWVAIENNNFEEAVTHFKEALRLDPTMDFAKTGLKEAIKSKNFLYRYVLKFFLWTSKMTNRARWQFIVGAYIVYYIFIQLAENYPSIAPFLYPFILAYIVMAFSSWISSPVSNAFLRFHPLGKLALTDDEKLASNVVGAFLITGIVFILGYVFSGIERVVLFGGWCILMLIPLGGMFSIPKEIKARQYLTYYTATLGIIGLLFVVFPNTIPLLYIFAAGIFFYGWVANYLMMKASKEF